MKPSLACAFVLFAAASCTRPSTTPWDSMTTEQRHEYMRVTVMPRISAAFVAFDPHRYAKLDCSTCHGKTGPERGWAMPNPDLLLEPSKWNTATTPDAASATSRMDAFMAGTVARELSSLVGRPRGCFACHTPEL